jgi:glycosyltransferase involved in cell wall biosynthesis
MAIRNSVPCTILFILPGATGGGAEKVAAILMRRLDRRRFRPVFAVLTRTKGLKSPAEDVPLIDLKAGRARFAWWPVVRTIRRVKPDIVFSFLGYLNSVVILARFFVSHRIRFVCRETNLPTLHNHNLPLPILVSFLYKAFYRFYDGLVCQSRDMADSLCRYACIGMERIAVIHNPVEPAVEENERIRHVEPEVYRLLAAGKLTRQKGFDLLLRAFAKVPSPKFQLTILGHGPEQGRLKELAAKLALTDRVRFAGFSKDVSGHMKEADLFVLSSRYEGFPNVLLEAGACGTPAVAFACPGGIRDIIVEGVNGWTVPAGDVDALAAAMERGVHHNWDRKRAKETVLSRFSADRIVTRYESFFESLT